MAFGRIIILEGNISAGKSTLCSELQKASPKAHAFFEPTETNPYLKDFYKDPPRFALKMQMWLFRQRFLTYLDALRFVMETGQDAILDRSVYSDWVFAQQNLLDKNICIDGYKYYMALRHHLLSELPLPHLTIYLRVSPEVCHDRIHNMRKRGCESSIPLAYLQGLHGCYDTLLTELSDRGSTVLNFDWNAFGSGEDVFKQIDRYSFEYSQPQWDRVRSLLDQVDRLDLNAHMWPVHLSEQATRFDERLQEVGAIEKNNAVESEAIRIPTKQKQVENENDTDPSWVVRSSTGSVRVGLSSTV